MPENEKILFPYSSLAEATKDKYSKIGGPDQAFRFLVKGFKSIAWRKRADANARAQDAEADAAFEAENGPVKAHSSSAKPPAVPAAKPVEVKPQVKPQAKPLRAR